MTNKELKEKIIELLHRFESRTDGLTEDIANMLVAEGFVDKSDYASMKETAVKYKAEVSKAENRAKEAEHRAEVAERAVYNLAYGEWQREGARRAICEKYAPSTARDYLDRAEKELEEEGKDDLWTDEANA